jgi:hypothetical protein
LCISDVMKLHINTPRVISISSKTNLLGIQYKHCASCTILSAP